MNAFTVTTNHPEWNALGRECCLRLQAYAGITPTVIEAKDQFDSHVVKLTHPLVHEGPVWFFDADWWMLREAALPEIPSGTIVATYCRTGHERYLNSAVDLTKVFGTTLYGADMSCPRIRSAFDKALHLQGESYWNGKPRADESFLNIAVQQAEIPVTMMGAEWNHCGAAMPNTIGLHAGGRWPKLDWMREALPK